VTSTEKKSEPIPSLKINFPDRALRDKFKAACALNSKNMNEVIIEFVMQYIKQNESLSTNKVKGDKEEK
jgi:hypothetical protein